MEDLENKKECGCGMHGHMDGHGFHHCGKHHLVKIILKLVIVIIIFWCGFKLGEITGNIRAERGDRMMDRGNLGMMRINDFSNMPTTNTGVPTAVPVK